MHDIIMIDGITLYIVYVVIKKSASCHSLWK